MKLHVPDHRPTEMNQYRMADKVSVETAQWLYRESGLDFPVSGDQSKIDGRVAPRAENLIWNRVELLGVFKEMDESGLA